MQRTTVSKADSARPDLADVERLTRGEGAKRRGTGSRDVPHRLNADERAVWELSKKRHFMVLSGAGYRRERKGSPLMNSWRQYADAFAFPAVFVHHGVANSEADMDADSVVVVDFSPLRCARADSFASARDACVAVASDTGEGQPETRVIRDEISSTEESVLTADQWGTQPIWMLPPLCVAFGCVDRPHAKALAERLAAALCGTPAKLVAAPRRRIASVDADAGDDGIAVQ
jgi:hypothetical protein